MAQFLTDEWLEQAKAIREEYRGKTGAAPAELRADLNIKDCPDGVGEGGVVEAHLDTSSGEMEMDLGHLDNPQVTVTVPYDVAKSIFIDQDQSAAMQAFMGGKIVATGDITKLMAMQSGAVDPVQAEIAAKIKAITD